MDHPASFPEHLAALADAHGVATSYLGAGGRRVEVAPAVVRAVLAALDVDARDEAAARRSLEAHRAERVARLLPDVHVVRRDEPASLRLEGLRTADGAEVALEDGARRELPVDGAPVLPDDLPLGHHRLRARAGDREDVAALVVAPAHCPLPQRRQWGWMTQLYQLRSQASWGIGDAGDLRALAEHGAGQLGAGFVLCNPLHAVAPVAPVQPSPYFPSSRRFANPLYLRVEDVPELAHLDADDRQRLVALADEGRALNAADRIDHDAVLAVKLAALELLHAAPRSEARERDLADFRARHGQGLEDFATFCALAERYGVPWQGWPAELHDPRSAAVAAARRELADRVELHLWLQWLIDEQLASAHDAARAAGMPLGIVHDLAVGVDPGGADAWALAGELAGGVRVGAPPDDFNQQGQDWGQPPLRPDRLLATGLRPLRDMLRGVLAHAGGVRIDHALGLFRLYWIPEGVAAAHGTYVRYPVDAMLATLALEAERADAVVVGEDLGTVGEGVRERLHDEGVLGSRVLYFEWDDDGRRRPASAYATRALASVTTHDLPTATGWWRGEDVRLRVELGLLGEGRDEAGERERAAADRRAMLELLRGEGLVGDDPDEPELVLAMHALLARTPCLLVAASPADAIGDPRQPNLPGTVDEYPNWRLPLAAPGADGLRPVPLERLLTDPRTRRLAEELRR